MGESNRRFEDESTSFTPQSSGNMLDLGITNTDEVLSRELNNFLMSDDTGVAEADPKDIKPITKDEEGGDTPKEKEKDKEDDTSASLKEGLSSFLEQEDEEDDEDTPPAPKKSDKEKDKKEEEDSNVYSELSKDLYKLGVFNHDDEEEEDEPIVSAEDFLDKFNSEKVKQANEFINNFLSRFGEDYREAFESIFLRGVHPKDYYSAQTQLGNFKDLDLKEVSNQKKVFQEYYKRQGLSQDKIDKKLERAVDMELLQEEAEDLHELLVEQDSRHIEELEQEKARDEHRKQIEDQKYSQSIQGVLLDKLKAKEFDGIPLTQKEAEETADYMITKKWKLPNGELLTDFDKDLLELKYPDNHELRVKMALLLRKKGDLTKIKQKAVSSKSEELFNSNIFKEKTKKRKNTFDSGTSSFFD